LVGVIHGLKLLVEAVILRLVLGDVKVRMVLFCHIVVTQSDLLLVSRTFNTEYVVVVYFGVKACLVCR